MAGIIQQKTDITLIPNPPSGSVLLSVDNDGLLKYKTEGGTVSLVGRNKHHWVLEEQFLAHW